MLAAGVIAAVVAAITTPTPGSRPDEPVFVLVETEAAAAVGDER